MDQIRRELQPFAIEIREFDESGPADTVRRIDVEENAVQQFDEGKINSIVFDRMVGPVIVSTSKFCVGFDVEAEGPQGGLGIGTTVGVSRSLAAFRTFEAAENTPGEIWWRTARWVVGNGCIGVEVRAFDGES